MVTRSFPSVRLRADEKRMVVATVIQIVKEACFKTNIFIYLMGKKVLAEGEGSD